MNFWNWLERHLAIKDDPLPKTADVIIAIGTGVQPRNTDRKQVSLQSMAIAEKAFSLWMEGRAGTIMFVGGYSEGESLTEAEAMYGYIQKTRDHFQQEIERVSPRVKAWKREWRKEFAVLEIISNRTYLNADYSKELMRRHGWKYAIIVAQQLHARRVRATFAKRWQGNDLKFSVVKASSFYGKGTNSQKRFDHFLYFACWDTLAFIISKFKGYC